jgi:hypothetical protein
VDGAVVADGCHGDTHIAWSNDVGRNQGDSEIWVMNADGTNQTQLTFDAPFHNSTEPAYSPGRHEDRVQRQPGWQRRDLRYELHRRRQPDQPHQQPGHPPAFQGLPVFLIVKVAPFNATGHVQFVDGTTPLGAPVGVTAGVALFHTSTLSKGTHSLTAVFTANNPVAFGPSTSPPVSLTVRSIF